MTRSPDGREILLCHDLRDNVSAILIQEHTPTLHGSPRRLPGQPVPSWPASAAT
jgi:hypothetical protein